MVAMASAVWSVSEERAVVVDDDGRIDVADGLASDEEFDLGDLIGRTLPHPGGELLARIACVNDTHLGETTCGKVGDGGPGPIFTVKPGEEPYPEVMNRAVAAEIAEIDPTAVIARGDLTGSGTAEQFDAFDAIYGATFGDRLHVTLGNHDTSGLRSVDPVQVIDVPGLRVVLVDTSRPDFEGGCVSAAQLDEIDAAAADADRPVLAMGHHPGHGAAWHRGGHSFALQPADTEALAEVLARRGVIGWSAGHTHRHAVTRHEATGAMPWIEVACTKDFPGAWAEYRVFEGGIMQVAHRVLSPEALAWAEATKRMYAGLYGSYAAGKLEDRCFIFPAADTLTG